MKIIEDEGIFISAIKFQDNSLIVSIFSKNNGLCKGIYRGSKKSLSLLQAGDIVKFVRKAKLESNIGNITCEVLLSTGGELFSDIYRLEHLRSICALLYHSLQEGENLPILYKYAKQVILALYNNNNVRYYYLLFELNLLSEMGFGLDITKCAVTNKTNNLAYISPRSGRAVCYEVGKVYENKLFLYKEFFININNSEYSVEVADYRYILSMFEFFLNKNLFSNAEIPNVRKQLHTLLKVE